MTAILARLVATKARVSLGVLLALGFSSVLTVKLWLALQYQLLVWDSYVYLLNARVFLSGPAPNAYFELLRPPLLPYLLRIVWSASGASVAVAELVGPTLTVGAAVVLYKLGTEMFGRTVGVFSSFIFLLTPVAFLWTNQVLTHGVLSFFVVVAVYCLWRARTGGSPRFYAAAGASMGLASLARYTGLLTLPIAAVFLVGTMVGVPPRRGGRGPTRMEAKWMMIGVLLFLAVWSPWLVWNFVNANGNPFASLMAGFGVASETGPRQPWDYYLSTLPSILGPQGVLLLLLGLASMVSGRLSSSSNRRPLLLLVLGWVLVFLFFYSLFPNKQPRFYVDWLMPLALLAGVGLDALLRLFERNVLLRALILVLTVVWLASISLTSIQVSYQDSTYNRYFFESRGFFQAADGLEHQMNATDRGAADYAPQFSYYAHRYFFSLSSLVDDAGSHGVSLDRYLHELHVKYIVATNEFVQGNQLEKLATLQKLTTIGDFTVYEVGSSA